MSTEQTKSILATFDAQDMVSPSFGAEALDELHKKSIDRSPETMKAVEHIMEHGYVILPSLLTPDQCARVKAAAHYYQGVRDQSGRTRFEGGKTTRVNNLLNKSDAADPLVLNEKMLNVLDHILSPNYLVSATQVIETSPGELKQPWHFDDGSSRQPRPRRHLFVNCFYAIDEFTVENGGTHLIPGSHKWGDELPEISGPEHPGIQATCPAGSCVMYLSTVWHAAGANRSNSTRMGVVCIFGEPWMRPYDNQFLATDPRDITKLPPRLQSLMGYSVGSPFLGWVDGRHPFTQFKKDEAGNTKIAYFERKSSKELLEMEKKGAKL